MTPELSVCIVNWNTRDLLDGCLGSLRAQADGLALEIVVVDNASSDDSAAMVAAKYPEVKLVASPVNTYYAAGNNQALRLATGPYKLLLNPDIIVQPGSLRTLLGFMAEHERAGAVAPRLRQPDGSVQRSCRTFPGPAAVWWEALGLSRLCPTHPVFGAYKMGWWDYDSVRPVDQPMASALLLRTAALDEIGLFDEDFPMFFNDVDLCRRLWDAQWQVWFTPAAEMIHYHGSSTKQVRREMLVESHRSFVHYYRKHYRARINPVGYGATVGLLQLSLGARLLAHDLRPKRKQA